MFNGKENYLLIIFVGFLLVCVGFVFGEITGEVITGEATQTVGMNITVTSGAPSLSIISPLNQTYINLTILLNYTVSGEESVWYNLDNSVNISITAPLTFTTTEGSHTLYLYANNSGGNVTTRSVTFHINETAVEEEEVVAAAPSGGGGGAEIKKFEIDKENIFIDLKQGETEKESFTIKNTGDVKLSLTIFAESKIRDFIKINEEIFKLKPGEKKEIILDILARDDTTPNLYVGDLIVKAGDIEKKILIGINVESKEALFDVGVEIPKQFREVAAGEEVLAIVDIFNFGEVGKVDVNIEYYLKNDRGETIVFSEETAAVETRISLNKLFHLPENMNPGYYAVYVRVNYNGQVASGAAWFMVVDEPVLLSGEIKFPWLYMFLLTLLIIALLILIIIYRSRKKEEKVETVSPHKTSSSIYH
ncbi:MAG: hypothetical protein ABIB79_00460 [archaeon]